MNDNDNLPFDSKKELRCEDELDSIRCERISEARGECLEVVPPSQMTMPLVVAVAAGLVEVGDQIMVYLQPGVSVFGYFVYYSKRKFNLWYSEEAGERHHMLWGELSMEEFIYSLHGHIQHVNV